MLQISVNLPENLQCLSIFFPCDYDCEYQTSVWLHKTTLGRKNGSETKIDAPGEFLLKIFFLNILIKYIFIFIIIIHKQFQSNCLTKKKAENVANFYKIFPKIINVDQFFSLMIMIVNTKRLNTKRPDQV